MKKSSDFTLKELLSGAYRGEGTPDGKFSGLKSAYKHQGGQECPSENFLKKIFPGR